MTTAVRFQALPPLSPDEYQALEQSILEHGVMVPVVVDEEGVVIDGHHRQKIAAEHELHCPKRTMRDLDDAEKRTLALTLNLDRRHLTREQRRALVAESIKADPQLSDREHGRRTGVDHKTAASVRDGLESTGEIPQSNTRVSADGRERPASQPSRGHADDDAETPSCRDCDGYGCETCVPEEVAYALKNEAVGSSTALDALQDQIDKAPKRKAPEPPITKTFWSANHELTKAVARVVRLSENDRFRKNKDQISGCHLSDLVRARDAINGVIQQLEG